MHRRAERRCSDRLESIYSEDMRACVHECVRVGSTRPDEDSQRAAREVSQRRSKNQKQNDDNRARHRDSQPASRQGLVEAGRAVVELEPAAAAAAAGEALLEELRELAREPAAALERAPALVRGGVVRVVPVVESLAQF